MKTLKQRLTSAERKRRRNAEGCRSRRQFDGAFPRRSFINATDIVQEYENESGQTVTLTDAQYLALLSARGVEELEQYAETLAFGSKINTNANLKYGTDYDLGDRVTCINKRWNVRIDVRITEIAETYETSGEEIDITFGESLPALLTQIRQITK